MAAAFWGIAPAYGYWIDKQVTVQLIVVRASDGTSPANPLLKLFEAETDKIWAQAGMDFQFLPIVYYNNSLFTNVSSGIFSANSFNDLALGPGHGQHTNSRVINLWFVTSINGSASACGYSLQSTTNSYNALIERNGVSIANSAFAYSGGAGMRDIFAYEIGRNLGLSNGTLGAAGDPKNLMKSSGPYPTSITNIYPDGLAFGHLTVEQIAMARRFSFVVDLPLAQQYSYPPLAAQPRLSVVRSPAGLTLSWTDPSASYVLQKCAVTNVASDGIWEAVSNSVTETNGTKQVIVSLNVPGQLFRLQKQ